jgi:hypothetical protein
VINRQYFEDVLPDPLRLMERPARLTLQVGPNREYVVHAIVAAHEGHVILSVYGDFKPPEHSAQWLAENPGSDPGIFDQVCLPYGAIVYAHLTARTTKGDERALIGFGRGQRAATSKSGGKLAV